MVNFAEVTVCTTEMHVLFLQKMAAANSPMKEEGPEGVKRDWDWPKIWVGKWDLIHWDWDFCTGNGTQNIKWEWEFCFNPLSKKDFFRTKFKQKSNNSVMEFYPIKK